MRKKTSLLVKPIIIGCPFFMVVMFITSCGNNSGSGSEDTEKIESNIKGTFKGWSGETLFVLANGQLWKQCSYAYQYSYRYNPEATIENEDGNYYLSVKGVDGKVKVCRINSFSHETVSGSFHGWHGDTVIKLMNGSEWKQAEPHIEIDIEVMPDAILYDDMGTEKLWVEGTEQPVSVIRN